MKVKFLPQAFLAATLFISLGIAYPTTSNAEKGEKIPDRMLAGTIIQYDDNNNMVIVEKGTPVPEQQKSKASIAPLTAEQQIESEKEEAMIKKIEEDKTPRPVYYIETPAPQPGLKVIYDGEGLLKDIILPNNVSSDVYGLNALPRGTRNPAGDYRYGPSNNVISISGDQHGSVIGTGRGTNFTDTYGENGNRLQRGDCATKGAIDNPKFGTTIRVRNSDNDIVHEFTKADNGSLPDAIIDIWKTGVEDLGLTWHSYTSFSGRYSYNF
ncbi:hypothetical protein L8C07_26225 [Paenibacillus sp. CMAA1739]|uniref:hypothetical protein n=1 Tax=Paenibacillus ottowii TaxID=2315729 RepID=UPI002731428A|nr:MULTISPECIES: hypothetical protein [Paenibacillus]MDP1513415.1 hypothetical protein [Paenibacillus ottowii]MEC4569438.1 hypothetical protein [Paenibacillus sp. CMAA1739]